ncbi:MAG TPA: hypothetical protein ENH02_05640 [Bacteroidetes bacterium]|nr:hypothetical protein [Bacteroidota bacterium]
MTTFQQIVLKCPYCYHLMSDYELSSFTIRGSTLYSDGKSVTQPYLQTGKAIKVCSSCNRPFWFEDAVIDREPDFQEINSLEDALDIYDLPLLRGENQPEGKIKYYNKLLKEGFANTNERKYYLRVRLWWAINDLVRDPFSLKNMLRTKAKFHIFRKYIQNKREQNILFKNLKNIFTENLSQLILLLDTENEDDLIILAEIYRETGKFRKAKHAIGKLQQTDGSVTRKIKKAVLFRKKKVLKV